MATAKTYKPSKDHEMERTALDKLFRSEYRACLWLGAACLRRRVAALQQSVDNIIDDTSVEYYERSAMLEAALTAAQDRNLIVLSE